MQARVDRPASEPEFGSFKPTGRLDQLIGLARRTSGSKGLYLISSAARKLALRHIGSNPVDYEYRGLNVRFRPRGNTAEKRALLNPSKFDAVELAFIEENLSAGSVFLDIGSNAGLYALAAARALGKGGQVLAFEPNPEVLERLTFNVEANAGPGPGLAEITVIPKAVTDQNGPVSFARPETNLGEGHVVDPTDSAEHAAAQIFEVEGTTLADCLEEHGITAISGLKIDIEGHELTALKPFFEKAPRPLLPGFILIERGSADHWSPLEELLVAHGYRQSLSCHMNEIWSLV